MLTAGVIASSGLRETWQNVVEGFQGDLPAYYVLLDLWSHIAGDSVFWLRLFSVVCGSLFILVVYKLAGLLFDRKTAILSAYLTAISPLLVFYSRVVRYYSLSSLLHLSSLYFFIKSLEKGRLRERIFYVLFTAAALYVNYSALLFIAAQALFILIYRRQYASGLKKWLWCICAVFILWLPIAWYFLRDSFLLLDAEGFVRTPLRGGWIANLTYLFFTFSLGVTVSPFNYPAVLAGLAVYAVVLARFLKANVFKKDIRRNIVFIILSILVVSLLCTSSGYNSSRYIKAVSGLYAICVAVGLLSFPRKYAIALILALSLVSGYSLHNLYARKEYHRKEFADSWDRISEYVDNNSDDKDAIIFNGLAFGYYMRGLNPVKPVHSMPEDEEGMRQLIREGIEQPKVKKVILVDSPLSGLRMKDFEDEIVLLKGYLDSHNYALMDEECFDRDKRAHLRRKLVGRPFPECRTKVYIYEQVKPKM